MEIQAVVFTVLVSGIAPPLIVYILARMLRFSANPSGLTDDEVIARNKSANKIVGALFLLGLIVPVSFYELFDIDENTAWPAALGFSFAVAAPVAFLKFREIRGGPRFEEFIRYGEIKDGVPRKGQLILFVFWVLVGLVAVSAALYQSIA